MSPKDSTGSGGPSETLKDKSPPRWLAWIERRGTEWHNRRSRLEEVERLIEYCTRIFGPKIYWENHWMGIQLTTSPHAHLSPELQKQKDKEDLEAMKEYRDDLKKNIKAKSLSLVPAS
ncbi:hypothetical protein HYALB_00013980 [Hymenoscyphus albidus]|uniref:Uncharacterized protein n=1 Tax=Hymenoscyphus albidus TaxID=595503 RepID=A0A9N9Q136_9HELO|nr:hypothetical protein HYALB_00013980 [Hymenoscyphus albidus]